MSRAPEYILGEIFFRLLLFQRKIFILNSSSSSSCSMYGQAVDGNGGQGKTRWTRWGEEKAIDLAPLLVRLLLFFLLV